MLTEELIKNYFLTKEQTIKAYLLGKDDELFLPEDFDHIKNTFKNNKKEARMIFYRINYFIALLIAVIILFFLLSHLPDFFSDPSIVFILIFYILLFTFTLFLKPLVHLFALKNKRSQKNIHLYKELYK